MKNVFAIIFVLAIVGVFFLGYFFPVDDPLPDTKAGTLLWSAIIMILLCMSCLLFLASKRR